MRKSTSGCGRQKEKGKKDMTKSLANEPVGDDERDLGIRNLQNYLREISHETVAENNAAHDAWIEARLGMVPKSAVEDAVRAERVRIVHMLAEKERDERCRLDMRFNEAAFIKSWAELLNPPKGEKE